MPREQGFTLIEIMISVAIIGILAVVSIPLYQGYVAKAQINRALGELGAYRAVIEDHISRSQELTNSGIGYTPSSLTTGTVATDIAAFTLTVPVTFK